MIKAAPSNGVEMTCSAMKCSNQSRMSAANFFFSTAAPDSFNTLSRRVCVSVGVFNSTTLPSYCVTEKLYCFIYPPMFDSVDWRGFERSADRASPRAWAEDTALIVAARLATAIFDRGHHTTLSQSE